MRRRISLYIADRPVDLDDESFILFNWAQEDLSNPTIVKNSYTQQITLKGTPANNAIFGDYFRVDRRLYTAEAGSGVGFNPSARTPFTIYNEMNEILQSGYVKLDQISASGRDVQYQVTLYGGLGSFFYALSYDDEGNKRTLADLDYLGTPDPDTELDFLINASSVQEAWNTSTDGGSVDSIWKVINFAPCYNGIPEGNFSADKALALTSDMGLASSYTENPGQEGEKQYNDREGYTLINLAREYDEWAVKDLRSYLQRPILSLNAFLQAVCNPDNNGGYEVDMDAIGDTDDFPYHDLWMTLPMLTEQLQQGQALEVEISALSSAWGTSEVVGGYTVTISELPPSNAELTANINIRLKIDANIGADDVSRLWTQILRDGTAHQDTAIFIQAVAYMGSDPVGGSKVACISTVSNADGYLTPESIAGITGYSPAYIDDDIYEPASRQSIFTKGSDGFFVQEDEMKLEVSSGPADRIDIRMQAYFIYGISNTDYHVQWSGYPIALDSPDRPIRDYYSGTRSMAVSGPTQDTIQIDVENAEIRSNARITKSILMTTEYTPADYLLSFCKMFGLAFTYDNATRRVTVLRRNEFYQDIVSDLTEMVDKSQGVTINPIAFDSKWYIFQHESDGGEAFERYRILYGQEYGGQRVNTGYDFDANTTELLSGSAFRSAVTVLETSKYFNTIILRAGGRLPSVFQDRGGTYTLYASDGDTVDLDVPVVPSDAIISYFNPANPGYDRPAGAKLQLHDVDNGVLDGSNVLLVRNGSDTYPGFHLSDDSQLMYSLNEGEPCWVLTKPTGGLVMPIYGRYRYGSDMVVTDSLDFGLPRELYVPGLSYEEDKTIYVRAWQKYLADRYDVNTKVMTCRVDFKGMQVGQELLRRFWWYGGSLWVLNSITNYSMTTWDLAECEFIQVQDKDNYLNGQY